jgi:hypothetical protein
VSVSLELDFPGGHQVSPLVIIYQRQPPASRFDNISSWIIHDRDLFKMFSSHLFQRLIPRQLLWQPGAALRTLLEPVLPCDAHSLAAALAEEVALVALEDEIRGEADVGAVYASQLLFQAGTKTALRVPERKLRRRIRS